MVIEAEYGNCIMVKFRYFQLWSIILEFAENILSKMKDLTQSYVSFTNQTEHVEGSLCCSTGQSLERYIA